MAISIRSTMIAWEAFILSKKDVKLSTRAIVGTAVGISLFLLSSILNFFFGFYLVYTAHRKTGVLCTDAA